LIKSIELAVSEEDRVDIHKVEMVGVHKNFNGVFRILKIMDVVYLYKMAFCIDR
jgi:hypothetical protein